MSKPSGDGAGASSINLDAMSLEELNQLKQQEEGRLQALTGRFGQLRAAAARLNASTMAISELSPASEDKDVMVPLTESVYVPGKIRDPTHFHQAVTDRETHTLFAQSEVIRPDCC